MPIFQRTETRIFSDLLCGTNQLLCRFGIEIICLYRLPYGGIAPEGWVCGAYGFPRITRLAQQRLDQLWPGKTSVSVHLELDPTWETTREKVLPEEAIVRCFDNLFFPAYDSLTKRSWPTKSS